MGLLELFEEGQQYEDVADFVEELLKNTRTYPTDWKSEFNHEIQKSLK